MTRREDIAEAARALLLPATQADPGRLPPDFRDTSPRSLRMASAALHNVLGRAPAHLCAPDAEWLGRLRLRASLEVMLHLAGCAVYGRVLRSHVGSPVVRALAARVGHAPLQELMRLGDGPADLPVPSALGDLRDAGGALLLDHLLAHAPAAARHLTVRMPDADIARWRRGYALEPGLRDALVQVALRFLDTADA